MTTFSFHLDLSDGEAYVLQNALDLMLAELRTPKHNPTKQYPSSWWTAAEAMKKRLYSNSRQASGNNFQENYELFTKMRKKSAKAHG
jgi:hypothetical protein